MICLDVGAGDQRTDGFVTVDAYNPAADVCAPMWDLPYETGTIDLVRSVHSLEHVPGARVAPTLREWRRVVRAGGRLELEVPDLDYVCRRWLARGTRPDSGLDLAMIFGLQIDDGQFHLTGFNRWTLTAALGDADWPVPSVVEGMVYGPEHDLGLYDPAPPWDTLPGTLVLGVWSHGQRCLRAVIEAV